MKTYWIVLPDCTSFKKHRAFFIKRGPLIQGHKIGCPRLEHLLNFTLRDGYSLWYDVILLLGVMGRENPQTRPKRFLVQFKTRT